MISRFGFPTTQVAMGLSMCASLSSLCGSSVQPVDERLQAARQGSVDARGELLEGCRAYLLLIANTDTRVRLACQGRRLRSGAGNVPRRSPRLQPLSRPIQRRTPGVVSQILMGTLSDFSRHYCQTAKRKLAREVPLDGSQQVSRAMHGSWRTISRRRAGSPAVSREGRDWRSTPPSRGCRPTTSR